MSNDEILLELPIKCSTLRRIRSVYNRCIEIFEDIIGWIIILSMCAGIQVVGLAFTYVMLSIGHNDYPSFSLLYYIVSYPYAGYISLILVAIMEFVFIIIVGFKDNMRIKCIEG